MPDTTTQPVQARFLYARTECLLISAEAATAMKGAGLETVWQMCLKTEQEMLEITGFTPEHLEECRESLRNLYLSFGMTIRGFPPRSDR